MGGSRQKKLGPLRTIEESQIVSCQCVAFDALAVGAQSPFAQRPGCWLVSVL
jgi:hypothetical protein